MTNRGRWLLTVAVILAVGAPALWPDPDDDFPISTYPMFTADRGRVVAIDTAVLVDAGDERHRLSPQVVGGTDEIVTAAVAVSRAIAAGDDALRRFCATVADRVDAPGTIEVVTEWHDAIALLREDAPAEAVTVHERCPAT